MKDDKVNWKELTIELFALMDYMEMNMPYYSKVQEILHSRFEIANEYGLEFKVQHTGSISIH